VYFLLGYLVRHLVVDLTVILLPPLHKILIGHIMEIRFNYRLVRGLGKRGKKLCVGRELRRLPDHEEAFL